MFYQKKSSDLFQSLAPAKLSSFMMLLPCLLMLSSCVETITLPNIPHFDVAVPRSSSVQAGARAVPAVKKVSFKKIKTETLLSEEGRWNLVEKSKSFDPAEAHMQARKNVNTKSYKADKKLAAHFDPNAKNGLDGNIRILRMEAKDGRWDDAKGNYEVASSQVSLPKWVVSQKDKASKSVMGHIASIWNGGDGQAQVVVKSDVVKVSALRQSPVVVKSQPKKMRTPLGHEIVNGVITPPNIPARRMLKSGSAVSDAVVIQKNVSGVIVPKRKPALGKSSLIPVAQDVVFKKAPKPPRIPNTKSSVSYIDPQVSSEATVTKIRSGEHSGKVRLVVELSSPAQFKAGIDDVRGVLRVKILNTDWGISAQDNFGRNALLGTYIARKKPDNSTLLEIRLKKKTRIIYSAMLRPNTKSKYRVVIDLEN